MKTLTHLAGRFVNTPLMIHPPKLDMLVHALGNRIGIAQGAAPPDGEPFAALYSEQAEDREYQVVDGIAVIPIQGVLTKKESWVSAYSGCSSYEQIGRYVQVAMNDAGVRAILLQVDSPGGETTGCLELSDFIHSQRGVKPIYAIADDYAFSAAYALASAADRIYLTRMGSVGSVGVVVLHTEDSKWSAEAGLKYTYLFAGAKKVDANPHEPLSERAAGDIQAEVDRQYEQFTATVARNRSADVDAIIATQAGTLWGEGAIPLLADEVGTIDDALNALRQLLGESSQCLTAAMAATSFTEVKATMDKEKLLVAAEGQEPDEDDKKNNNDDGESEFCHACGTRLKEGAKFCHACGEPVGGGTVKGDARKEGSGAPAGLSLIEGAVHNVRPEGDIAAISALCKMAGCPNKTIEFVMAKNAKGQFLTVAEVSEALAADRVAESEKRMIHSHVNPNAGSGGVHEIEAQAASLARQNNGQATPGLYVTGTAVKLTKERAYAQMIEEHPEAYEAFRGQHNAAPLVAQLQRAGVRMIQ